MEQFFIPTKALRQLAYAALERGPGYLTTEQVCVRASVLATATYGRNYIDADNSRVFKVLEWLVGVGAARVSTRGKDKVWSPVAGMWGVVQERSGEMYETQKMPRAAGRRQRLLAGSTSPSSQ